MLDELIRNIKYQVGKDGLLFFFCDVLGHNEIPIQDVEVICSHAQGKRHLSASDIISYCIAFGWINKVAEIISVSPFLDNFIRDKETLNTQLVLSTIEQLFDNELFNPNMFSFDSIHCCYSFKNELLPLSLSSVRNVLISQGFLITERDNKGTHFYISSHYDNIIATYCKTKRKQLSLSKLKKQIEDNELAGEKAELFVLAFEKARIGQPLSEKIKRISEIDVSAGYDIVSFNSCESQKADRFIEVKAISNFGFYWSRNEYEIAKLKGEMYYLYLVELSRINEQGYIPQIINNPATNIMKNDLWFIDVESYHIKHI